MADVRVKISQDNAVLLLAEAEKQEQDPSVVRTSDGWFVVEEGIASKAGVKYETDEDEEADQAAAKKAAAVKKAAAKRESSNQE